MKTNLTMHSNSKTSGKTMPNSEAVSRQIENLRVVLRRMKASESSSRDSIISQKLKALK